MHPSFTRLRRSGRGPVAASLAVVVAGALAVVPGATAAETSDGDQRQQLDFDAGRYVVLLEEASATRYRGGTDGIRATRQSKGFDEKRKNVRAYEAHLRKEQRKVAKSVGADIDRGYTLASNGFTAELSAKQATKLATDRRVQMVVEDTAFSIDTWNTPSFLGLDGRRGVWAQNGGTKKAGSGVVVGILDTGTWPESDSFEGKKLKHKPKGPWDARRKGKTTMMEKADGSTFTGYCDTGDGTWSVNDCSTKLIGARYYPDSFLAAVPPEERADTEYLSPRDGGGHGSHTAGTAAGNHGVDASVEGRQFGEVSGMAPAAAIATYKVCFEDTDPDTGGCYTSSTLDALDDAVADGVDVVNYSISGATDTVVDAVEFAFLGAADAGIFVAASAGNSGPGASTVAHNSPWVTTVAASTHTRFENTVMLGNGDKIKGASIASADQLPGETPLVHSVDVGNDSADPNQVRLCYPGTLDPAKVDGSIVLCERGAIARVDKSAAVDQAGGTGMVLANTSPNSLDADFHSVPTVHVDEAGFETVTTYMEGTSTPTAHFDAGDTTGGAATPVPQTAGFSSRGPAIANDGDVLKPDITAPGVSVLAPVAPPTNSGRDYDLYSGTSMSSPHVAGLAAFILGENPNWSPMAVKSAMMTTAFDVKDSSGAEVANPFAQGAGHVDPTRFLDPGLVVTSGTIDWLRFMAGQGYNPWGIEPMAATDLNGPSIADGAVTASMSTSRTFTGLESGAWKVQADVPGFSVEHDPAVTIGSAGESQAVDFTFTREDAPIGEYATGFVTLTGPTTVRIPVALRPVAVDAPDTVRGEGATGSTDVDVTVGFDGDLVVSPTGLAPADTREGDLAVGEQVQVPYTVGDGTELARFDLDAVDDRDDMDLYLYDANGSLVDYSATGSADESITLRDLAAGDYTIVIDSYSANEGTSVPFRFDGYLVDGTAAAGDLSADPASQPVSSGDEATYTVSWTDLASGRYLGYVDYEQSTDRTYVYVDVAEAGSAG